jgi:hypothetical protein
MPQPVKLSDSLVDAARATAADADRSMASQIEHWANLGRVVEEGLRTSTVLAVKSGAVSLEQALPAGDDGAAILAALTRVMSVDARATVAQKFKGKVRYGTDPAFPGCVVRLEPDGRRTPGHLVGREFQPLTAAIATRT